jgi:hypothetical protein
VLTGSTSVPPAQHDGSRGLATDPPTGVQIRPLYQRVRHARVDHCQTHTHANQVAYIPLCTAPPVRTNKQRRVSLSPLAIDGTTHTDRWRFR